MSVIYVRAHAALVVQDQVAEKRIDWKTPLLKCWEMPLATKNLNRLASDNQLESLFHISGNLLTKINPPDGREIWRIEVGGNIKGDIYTDRENIYILLDKEIEKSLQIEAASTLRAISKLTGVTKWQTKVERTAKLYLTDNQSALYIVDQNGLATIIDRSNGGKSDRLRAFPTDTMTGEFKVRAFPAFKKTIFLDQTKIYLMSSDPNRPTREFKAKHAITSVEISESELFWGDSNGNISAFEAVGGRLLWSTKAGGKVSALSATQDGLLVSSFDNFLYFYSPESGNLIWKKRLANRITNRPMVTPDVAVVVSYGNNIADIIDLKNGQTINRISLDVDDFFVDTPLFINNLLIFQTTLGFRAYGNDGC